LALTGIALFEVALTLCLLTLPFSPARCALTLAIVALPLVLAIPLVPEVAVRAAR
jgi:hypothetical protein